MQDTFASYEKEIKATVVRINHFVRIQKGETVRDIEATLNNIPSDVCLKEFVDLEDHFEMLFIEEREE